MCYTVSDGRVSSYSARWLAAAQCIVIGPVCLSVCVCVCVCVCVFAAGEGEGSC